MTQPQQPHFHFDGIQALRFVAALLVAVTHASFYATERLPEAHGHVWSSGAIGVTIFFIISGFVMVVSSQRSWGQPDAWKKFFVRRLVRIVPMYWLATSLKVLALLAIPALVLHAKLNIAHIIDSYFFIPSYNNEGSIQPFLGVGWTLFFEMFFYIVFTIALFLKKHIFLRISIVLCIMSGLSFFVGNHPPAYMVFFSGHLMNFFFGMLIAYSLQWNIKVKPFVPAAMIVVSLMLLVFRDVIPLASYGGTIHLPRLLSAVLVAGCVYIEPFVGGRIPRWILVLGDASYVIYLFHPLFSPAIPELLHKLDLPYFWLSVLLSAIAACIVGTCIHLIIDQPVTNYLKRVTKPIYANPAAKKS